MFSTKLHKNVQGVWIDICIYVKDPKIKTLPLKEEMSQKDLTHEGKITYVSKKIKFNNKCGDMYKSMKRVNKKNVRARFFP